MENTHSDAQAHGGVPAEKSENKPPEEKTSRYDDPFYKSIFGAFDGPPDLARRSKEIFGEIMDKKHRRCSD